MKKIYIWLLFLIFFYTSYANVDILNTKVYKIKNTENKIFKLNNKKLIEPINNMFLGCFDSNNKRLNNVKFLCKEKLVNNLWCWIIIDNDLKTTDGFCLLKTKNSKSLKINFLYEKKLVYKDFLDISKKIKQFSIQNKPLSCEISATSDLISTIENDNISEDFLLDFLPKSDFYNKTFVFKKWIRIWWNPNKWFVWYIDKYNWREALQYKYEWYWVYEKPISEVYKKYWIKTKVINEFDYNMFFWEKEHLTLLLKELYNWNLVQLWWDYCTTPSLDDWKIKLWSSQTLTQDDIQKGINAKNVCYKNWNFNRKLKWNYFDENDDIKEIEWLNW